MYICILYIYLVSISIVYYMTSIMQWTTLIHAMIEVLNNYEYEDSVVIKASNII